MSKEKYKFELWRGFNLENHFEGTFQDARLRGDRLASRLGNVSLYAYNEPLRMWEHVGTFIGHMRYVNKWGDQCIIKSDYSGLEIQSYQQLKEK
jgi:hypothetical protein